MAKRNIYALAILLLLAGCIWPARIYVRNTICTMKIQITAAYGLTQGGQYSKGNAAFVAVSQRVRKATPLLRLLVRRSLWDKASETIATLPFYATPENTADLGVEVHRALAQLTQLQESFLAAL